MKLFFDIGNSRIKWAFDRSGEFVGQGEIAHRQQPRKAVADLVARLQAEPEVVYAVNVAGDELAAQLQAALQERFGHQQQLQVLRTGRRHGDVINGYEACEQLGADRWAAIVGARQWSRETLCVVDVGTAVTIDTLCADGRHLGGYIVPGLALMQEALLRDTSDIQDFVVQAVTGTDTDATPGPGIDTRSAVARGALLTICAVIEKVGAADGGARIVLTGGDAASIARHLDASVELRPFLVLEGVRALAAES